MIDVTDSPYIGGRRVHHHPMHVGSGGPPLRPKNLPKFPNNTDLVFDESNSELLSALLPALNRYQCLEFGTKKRRRSPWVRAFCDLYHPAGPFGSNKFSNAPDITSNRKYSFKSYQIPTLYKQLKKYGGDSKVHLELKSALEEYFGKDDWHREFLQGCELVAAHEVNKPSAERAAIPTVEAGVVVAAAAAASVTKADEDTTISSFESPRRRKRKKDPAPQNVRTRTRSQRRQKTEQEWCPGEEEEEDDSEAEEEKEEIEVDRVHLSPSTRKPKSTKKHIRSKTPQPAAREHSAHENPPSQVVQQMVSPESANSNKALKKESLEQKRAELVQLLELRRGTSNGTLTTPRKDALCAKIQKQIDVIDEEILELILG